MNKLIFAVTVLGTMLLVTGCGRDRVYYTPTYTTPVYTTKTYYAPATKTYTKTYYTTPAAKIYTKTYPAVKTYYTPGYAKTYYTPAYTTPAYTYSVGYQTSPYWDIDYYNDSDAYYYGYNDLGNVGYWGMYNTYQVY
ncbi:MULTISPECIES: hypothetical protein [Legionella]|uniref:Lipoprotein n=1 Tax=Legionella resiliens TaxID=2905958 RepID=A0ABS8WYG0_9GAMM|nr:MULTISPECIES: hypothetical protein [unclassified Legionella]MCE0721610.1 hypothetical protein [Legionella sp. 9fVS26]MCE3530764.1 hypothetical protein [Legionella sp. 8cVS16]QLZ70325.1 hypothetical protein FOLKNPGA_03139 [Legionella sp. PC1000]